MNMFGQTAQLPQQSLMMVGQQPPLQAPIKPQLGLGALRPGLTTSFFNTLPANPLSFTGLGQQAQKSSLNTLPSNPLGVQSSLGRQIQRPSLSTLPTNPLGVQSSLGRQIQRPSLSTLPTNPLTFSPSSTPTPSLSFSMLTTATKTKEKRPQKTAKISKKTTNDKLTLLNRERERESSSYRNFTLKDCYLPKGSPKLDYFRRTEDKRTVFGWGQLKLILAEILGLITYWDPQEVPNLIVVYAGAAVGHHFKILSRMFPTIREWHLYDSEAFGIEEDDKIKLHKELFTDDIARYWSLRGSDIFFFSDIRSIAHNKDINDPETGLKRKPTDQKVEDGIWSDMEAQRRWTEIMKPYQAHLKMRLPYIYAEDSSVISKYLDGDIMLQAFVGPSSTETRLIPIKDENGNYKEATYNNKDYESMLFRYNSIVREANKYLNPITGIQSIQDDSGELSNNYDSIYMLFVLSEYMKFMGEGVDEDGIDSDTIEEKMYKVLELSKVIREDLSSKRTKPISISSLKATHRQEEDDEEED